MRRLLTLIAAAIALTACATSIMQGYVGKPIQEVMLDYGPPANAFDMPDGSRAFQWTLNTFYTTPTTVSSSTVPVGNVWLTNTQISGGQAMSSSCTYTMLAHWDATQNTWVFHDYHPPSMMCQ